MFRMLLVVVLCGLGTTVLAQENPPPTPAPVQSLFLEDPCTPPCWYGIIPGESTITDVQEMFRTYAHLFDHTCSYCGDPMTRLRPGRTFEFQWAINERLTPLPPPGAEGDFQEPTYLRFDDNGILDNISAYMDRTTSLTQVRQAFGEPDVVYLGDIQPVGEGEFARYLTLVYIPLRSKVHLWTYPEITCTSGTVNEDFTVDFVSYSSIAYATGLFEVNWLGLPHTLDVPRLVSPSFLGRDRQLNADQWQAFTEGIGYDTCETFYTKLPQTYTFPTLPWSTLSGTATPSLES
jgi:hypothetical protein